MISLTGNISVTWAPQEMKIFGWVNAISLTDQRVLVGPNMRVENESNMRLGPGNATYTEQVMCQGAETGKLLAASDYSTPISSGSQLVPRIRWLCLSCTYSWSHNGFERTAGN